MNQKLPQRNSEYMMQRKGNIYDAEGAKARIPETAYPEEEQSRMLPDHYDT